jgi:hypothetical protein
MQWIHLAFQPFIGMMGVETKYTGMAAGRINHEQ